MRLVVKSPDRASLGAHPSSSGVLDRNTNDSRAARADCQLSRPPVQKRTAGGLIVPNFAPQAIKYIEGLIPAENERGRTMQNQNDLDQEIQSTLDFVGGERLTGSGFEAEPPEPGFDSEERRIGEVL
jgi:hypothetical protein